MRRALVLSGGGAKGSWQVGACKHLIAEKRHWFDVISGVSVGAINGATLAHAQDPGGLRASSLSISGALDERHRHICLRILQPVRKLAGLILDFDPAKIRAWYEDGLGAARSAQVGDLGDGEGHGPGVVARRA